MKKIGKRRLIQSINEIHYDFDQNKILIHPFFKYIPQSNQWNNIFRFENSYTFSNLSNFRNITGEKYNKLIKEISKIFEKKFDPTSRNVFNPLKDYYKNIIAIMQFI